MPEPTMSMVSDPADDLPRTLRREREARERAARVPDLGAAREPVSQPAYRQKWAPSAPADDLQPAVIRAIDVPFLKLVTFFLKASIAALPALALLTLICIGAGQVLKLVAPDLRVFRVVIETFPTSAPQPSPALRPAEAVKAPPPAAAKK
jgi:hypothetical protein